MVCPLRLILFSIGIIGCSAFHIPSPVVRVIAHTQLCRSLIPHTSSTTATSSSIESYRHHTNTFSLLRAGINEDCYDEEENDNMEEHFDGIPLNPSYVQLIAFTLTACTNWFAEPVQSLVDTVVVGRQDYSQLAALGPATIVFDAGIFLCYFLSVATTTRLGKAIAKKDVTRQQIIMSQSLGVAVVLGFITMAIILGFGRNVLGWIAGKSLVDNAMSYASIRVICAPASVVRMVCDSISLAYLDTVTSALTVLTATAINIIGDYLLCIVGNFGIRGAATATAFAEFVACSILLYKVRRRFKSIEDNTNTGGQDSANAVAGHQIIPFIQLPDSAGLFRLLKFGGPILFVILGELACQFMTTLKATSCGVLSLATHNIILRLYLFFATFGDGLSATVQAFLPRFLYQKDTSTAERNRSAKRLLTKFGVVGIGFSVLCSTAAFSLTTLNASLFTMNQDIVRLIRSASVWLSGIFLLQPLNLLLEGAFTVRRDFKFLVSTYTVSIAFLAIQMHLQPPTLSGVWKGFLLFHIVRLAQFGFRTKQVLTSKKSIKTK